MSASIHTNVSVYRHGRLQQGYALEGDKTKIVVQSRGFSITVEMQDNVDEDRPQASIKVCGHEIFNTEDHALKNPDVVDTMFGRLESFVSHADLEEARTSTALDGQTQSAQRDNP